MKTVVVLIFCVVLSSIAPLSAAGADPAREAVTLGDPWVAVGAMRLDTRIDASLQVPTGWRHRDLSPAEADADPFRLVKFSGAVGARSRELLRSSGFDVVAYYPESTFLVRALDGRSPGALDELDGVQWTGRLHPYMKLEPNIAAAVQFEDVAALMQRGSGLGLVVRLTLHPGEQRETVAQALSDLPGIVEVLPGRGPIRVRLERSRFVEALRRIASRPEVAIVERWQVPVELNDENVQTGQSGVCFPSGPEASNTPIFARGLTGWNSRVAVADVCIDANEGWFYDDELGQLPAHETDFPWTSVSPDWAQRKIIEYYDMHSSDTTLGCAGNSGGFRDHGTKVAGVLLGNCSLDAEGTATSSNAANSDGDDDGMAPGAQMVVQDLGNLGLSYFFDGGNLGELIGVAYDNTCDGTDCGIDVHHDSWGSSNNAYGTDARTGDAELWSRGDLIVVAAAGNTGPGTGTVHDPATAKNVIAVGSALGCSVSDMAGSSSRGPASDGRLKPDLVASGTDIQTALNDGTGDVNANGGCSTTNDGGTSFAAPTISGLAALAHQYFVDGFYPSGSASPADGFDPSGRLLKGLLINSARQMSGAGAEQNGAGWPNMDQGYGYVVLDDGLYFDGDTRKLWVHDEPVGVDASGANTMSFRRGVSSSSEPLKVTLAWYDRENGGTCGGVARCLQNDLELTVLEESSGDVFSVTLNSPVPGQLLPRTLTNLVLGAGQTTIDGGADDLNPVEQVIIYGPETGTNYTFTVRAVNTPDGPVPFALVATGAIVGPCEPMVAPGNNQVVDLDECLDTGVRVSWDVDPGDWGDDGSDRFYHVFRDNTPILSGECAGALPYGTSSCVDDSGPDDVSATYRVLYVNRCGATVTTNGASATDDVPPVVTIAPLSPTEVCPGSTVSLLCSASPSGPSYDFQWFEDGEAMPGQINPLLLVTEGEVASHTYNCQVTDPTDSCSAFDPVSRTVMWTVNNADVDLDPSFDPATSLTETCGDGDAVVEPGEFWDVTMRLANTSACSTAVNARADLVVRGSSAVDASICGSTGYYGTIPPGGTSTSTYSFQVDPATDCGNDIDFDIDGIWWTGGEVPGAQPGFSVQAGEPPSGVVENGVQDTDPLEVSSGLGFTTFLPELTVALPDQVTLDYTLGCDVGPLTAIFSSPFSSLIDWTESGEVNLELGQGDTCSGGGGLYVRMEGNATLTRAVNTTRFTETRIRVDVSGSGSAGPSDCLEWRYSLNGGSNWTTYKTMCGSEIPNGSWTCGQSLDFPSGADDNPNFRIRFRTVGDVDVRLDNLAVEGIGFACQVKSDVKVELLRTGGGGVYLIKDLGDSDPAKPIDVTSLYDDAAGGPGLWALRVTEAYGGTARIDEGLLSLTQGDPAECDLSVGCACPASFPGEVSDDPPSSLNVERNGPTVNIVFEDIGAAAYNVYVSTLASTSPFDVTSTEGKRDCGIAVSPGPNGTLKASGYPVEQDILVPSHVYYILVTGDDGGSTEGGLGFASSGAPRTANASCIP